MKITAIFVQIKWVYLFIDGYKTEVVRPLDWWP